MNTPINPGLYLVSVCAQASLRVDNQWPDGETIQIGARVYEIDRDATFPESGGDVVVDTSSSPSVEGDIAALVAAINGDELSEVVALADLDNHLIHLYAREPGAHGNEIQIINNLNQTYPSGDYLTDGADADTGPVYRIRHVVQEGETIAGRLRCRTGFSAVKAAIVQYQSHDNGQIEPIQFALDGSDIIVNYVGSWNAGDIITVVAIGTP